MHQRDAVRLLCRLHLLQPDTQHGRREIDADDPAGTRGLERDVGGSRADVYELLASRQLEGSDRARTPAAIDAGTEDVIEQVVARRNRVEHARDAVRRLVRGVSQ
jgi:hypothetical protein